MRKRFNTLNEEINRMKSLFTEERMFGNLVTESVIKVGSKGDGVKSLQRLLGIKDDGIFGPQTKNALIAFQKKNGLKGDGVVGPKTFAALENNVLNETFLNEGGPFIDYEKELEDLITIANDVDGAEIDTEKIEKAKEKKKEEEGGDKKEKKDFPDADGDGVPDSIDKDSGNTPEPVKGPEGETSSTTVTKDKDGTETTVTTGKDGKTSSTTVTKGDEEGEKSEQGEEKEKGMPGTEAEGDSYDRGQKKDTIKGVLADIKSDKGIINDNVSNCKKSIKMIYRQIKRVGSQDLNLTDGELKNLDWCVSTFKNRFGKPGFGVNAKEVSTIYRILKREIPKFTGETVEKETYDVMMGKRKIAKVKMLGGRGGGNKFRFNGRKGFLITKKDRENDTQIINPKYEKYFLKSLGFGDDKEIVILRSDGNNGTFTIN